MSIRAALARQLGDLGAMPALLSDLEGELDLALAHQQMARMAAAPRVLLAIERAGCTEVYEVELVGVEWIECDAPDAEPPPPARVWEEELPNRLVRPLGAAAGLGAMLEGSAPPHHSATLIARLIGEE